MNHHTPVENVCAAGTKRAAGSTSLAEQRFAPTFVSISLHEIKFAAQAVVAAWRAGDDLTEQLRELAAAVDAERTEQAGRV